MIRAIKYTALASALALTTGSAAWAQSYGTERGSNASDQSAMGQSPPGTVSADTQQKIRQSLEQNGFRNIQVLPEAYVIRAQAPDGSHVAMLLTPDQVTEVVTGNAGAAMSGAGPLPYGTMPNSQSGYGNGQQISQQQAQQELSRYGYSDLQNVTPMRGWVAEATRNGQNVRILLSENGLVATFPGR